MIFQNPSDINETYTIRKSASKLVDRMLSPARIRTFGASGHQKLRSNLAKKVAKQKFQTVPKFQNFQKIAKFRKSFKIFQAMPNPM